MPNDPIVIVSIARTASGNLLGNFKSLSAPQLGAIVMKAAALRAHLQPNDIDEVLMGCVLAAGQGQAPARQAALAAGFSITTPCTTINKMCGSGIKTITLAHDTIMAGTNNIVLAGGMESMTNAPYLLPKLRQGYRMGHQQILDHMFFDGLEDAYEKGRLMGTFADNCAKHFDISREQQDEFAIASIQRAYQATEQGYFTQEIAPVTLPTRQEEITIDKDEMPNIAKLNKISTLKPAFNKEGTVTAANSSSISDGAASIILMRRSEADKRGIKPLAVIRGHVTHAQEPQWFTTAPIDAIHKLSQKINWPIETIDLFEINEAFAVVTLVAMQALKLPHEKVNIHGGACALGHPIGASGARLVVTLISALQRYGLKRGLASLCIGGGEAIALAIEVIS